MSAEAEPYRSDEEVLEVVRRFEACEFEPDDFKHRQHLVVALCYLLRGPERDAHAMVRGGIFKFLAHHRIDPAGVYHETLTVFWMRHVCAFLSDDFNEGRSLLDLANELAETADKRLPLRHYSRELLFSWEARLDWVEPDLKPFN